MEWAIQEGDARERLRELPDESIQCVLTSPPYWGLRDYKVPPSVWGGEPGCEHDWDRQVREDRRGKQRSRLEGRGQHHRVEGEHATCTRCGAWRGQLGFEPDPDLYVEHVCEVFDEVWRVLRPDGVAWINIADTFAAAPRGNRSPWLHQKSGLTNPARQHQVARAQLDKSARLAPKQMALVPARLALELQRRGWVVRGKPVWSKLSCLPERVLDRFTQSYEEVLQITKSPRYLFDPDDAAVREASGANRRDVIALPSYPYKGDHTAVMNPKLAEILVRAATSPHACGHCGSPFKRVIAIDGETTGERADTRGHGGKAHGHPGAPQNINFAGRHDLPPRERRHVGWRPSCACGAPAGVRPGDFDVMESPTAIGTGDPSLDSGRAGFDRPRVGGCRSIPRWRHAGFARQIKASPHRAQMEAEARAAVGPHAFAHYIRCDRSGARAVPAPLVEQWLARAWLVEPAEPEWDWDDSGACVVLDPFAGAATSGVAATRAGCSFIGIELSARSVREACKRMRDDAPLINEALEREAGDGSDPVAPAEQMALTA